MSFVLRARAFLVRSVTANGLQCRAMGKNQYLYQMQLTRPELLTEGPTESEAEVLKAHGAYLEGLVEAGTVLLAGRTQTTDPEGFGIVILEAESESAARELMENDPPVKVGLMTARLFPYRIAMVSESISGSS